MVCRYLQHAAIYRSARQKPHLDDHRLSRVDARRRDERFVERHEIGPGFAAGSDDGLLVERRAGRRALATLWRRACSPGCDA
jgi:hypothetical protein